MFFFPGPNRDCRTCTIASKIRLTRACLQGALNALTSGDQALIFGGLLGSRELRDSLRVQSVARGGIYREWAEVRHISHREPPRGS